MTLKFTKDELSLISMRCMGEYDHYWGMEGEDDEQEKYFREMEKDCKDTANMAIRNISNKKCEHMREDIIQYVFNMEEEYEDGDTTHSIRQKVGLD